MKHRAIVAASAFALFLAPREAFAACADLLQLTLPATTITSASVVAAGTFNTIVVQPIIKTKGLFSEGGQAELYFTDDDRRILVQLKSKVKVLKSLDMHLTGYSPPARRLGT